MSAPDSDNRPLPATKTGGFNYWQLLSRIVIFALLLSSAGLLWWSYYQVFVPQLRESRQLNATVSKLTAEVDDLDRQWSKAGIEEVNQKFTLVQPRLFAGQAELAAWLADFKEQTAPMGLDVKTDFADSNAPAGAVTNVQAIPVTIAIAFPPLPSAAGSPGNLSPCQRLLQFAQRLTTREKCADLAEMTVEGGTNSIARAVLGVNFWTAPKESP